MSGVITGRDVLRHAWLVARLYGARTLIRCILACARRERTTFLSLTSKA